MKNQVLFYLLCFYNLHLHAQTQFTNNGNLKIFTGTNITFFGNLTNNGILVDSGLVTTFKGTTPQAINGSSITTFNNLCINNTSTSGVSLLQPIYIQNTLKLNSGLLNTNATNILIMKNGATTNVGSSASASYVNGPMKYQKSTAGTTILNFPIGKGGDCRPISLTVNHSNATLYNYQAESFNADARLLEYNLPVTIDSVSSSHYWSIDRTDSLNVAQPTAGLSGNQTIQIFFGNNDNVILGNLISIVKNTNTDSSTWFDIGGSDGPAYNNGMNLAGSITSTSAPTAFNSFSKFTLGYRIGGLDPLPIELLYFNAKADGKNVTLNWSTASEINNDHFEVERSADGVIFEPIINVKAYGDGNSNKVQLYSIIDNDPLKDISYYRLKQVDKDGASEYSEIEPINFTTKPLFSVYPNPTLNNLIIDAGEIFQNGSAKIVDVLGNEILIFALHSYKNFIDVSALSSGVYYLLINSQETDLDFQKIKIIIQK